MYIYVLCLKTLKFILYPGIKPLFVFIMGIVAMPIINVYMYIDIYRGPQGANCDTLSK